MTEKDIIKKLNELIERHPEAEIIPLVSDDLFDSENRDMHDFDYLGELFTPFFEYYYRGINHIHFESDSRLKLMNDLYDHDVRPEDEHLLLDEDGDVPWTPAIFIPIS